MKIRNILYAIAFTMPVLTSCVDLERYPLEELSDNSYWKAPKDAEMAVSDLYIIAHWDVDDAINSDDAVHGINGLQETSL